MFCYVRNISACLLFASLQLFVLFAKAQPAKGQVSSKDTTKVKLDFNKVYQGEIDSLWRVVIIIESKEGVVNGKVNYVDYSNEIQIKGKIDKLGNINITGFDSIKNEKISISGKFVSKEKIIGLWILNAGIPIKHRFFLNEIMVSYDVVLKNIINEKKESFPGFYSYKNLVIDKYRLDLRGSIEIEKISEYKFKFKIYIYKYYEKISNPDIADDCEGELEGVGNLDSLGIGYFSDEECGQIKFHFLKNAIDISESECDFYHGLSCGFSGIYYRNKKSSRAK